MNCPIPQSVCKEKYARVCVNKIMPQNTGVSWRGTTPVFELIRNYRDTL